MMARAHKKTEKLLKEHEVDPLPKDVKKRIEEIIEESKKLVK
jgi:trimethylamine:corrinoid methyltransferase-like protein